MKKNCKNLFVVLSLLFVIFLMPCIYGQAAGSGYQKHWLSGKEPREVITGNYKLSPDWEKYRFIKLIKGNKVIKSNISCNGSVLYSSKDFYYVDQNLIKKAVIYKMDLSGKSKKVAAISGLSGQLVLAGAYQNLLYCYTEYPGDIYKVNINSKKSSKIYSMNDITEISDGCVVSGKYLYFKNCSSASPLVRIDMATGKASVSVKKDVDKVWSSGSTVYISTNKYDTFGDTSKITSTIKKLNTKSSKFVKVTSLNKARVIYANTGIIFYEKNGQYYIKLRKLNRSIKIKSDDYWDMPVVKGDYCYYITYSNGKKYSSTLWKVSLKNAKTTKVKTVQGGTLRFTGAKAGYYSDAGKYVYYTLK